MTLWKIVRRRPILTAWIGLLLIGFACVMGPVVSYFFVTWSECKDFVAAPKRTAGPPIPAIAAGSPEQASLASIPDSMIINGGMLKFDTTLQPAEVFATYQQKLEANGWKFVVRNSEKDKLFMGNSQGCPFYGLDITAKASGKGTAVTVEPYTNFHTCSCGDF